MKGEKEKTCVYKGKYYWTNKTKTEERERVEAYLSCMMWYNKTAAFIDVSSLCLASFFPHFLAKPYLFRRAQFNHILYYYNTVRAELAADKAAWEKEAGEKKKLKRKSISRPFNSTFTSPWSRNKHSSQALHLLLFISIVISSTRVLSINTMTYQKDFPLLLPIEDSSRLMSEALNLVSDDRWW